MEIVYSCFGKSILLSFPNNLGNNVSELDFWTKRFCPSIKSISFSDNYSVDYKIECVDSTHYSYRIYKNRIVISGIWYNYESFLAKFITQVFQNLLFDNNIVFIPAACVIKNNSAILIVGDFWQGKTSVALGFVNRYNFSLLSDNYIAIQNNTILGGTSYLSLKQENLHTSLDLQQNIFIHDNRAYFNKSECKTLITNKPQIIGILIPHINNNDNNFHFISYNDSVWFLYQKLTRLINGESVFFTDIIPSPNFNNKKKSKQILTYTTQLLQSCSLLYASASLDIIIDNSLKLFEKSHKYE